MKFFQHVNLKITLKAKFSLNATCKQWSAHERGKYFASGEYQQMFVFIVTVTELDESPQSNKFCRKIDISIHVFYTYIRWAVNEQ
jgi:hypothetical protein